MGIVRGKKMGIYEGDPAWDDVIPILQEDVKGALAAITYTEEYSEGEISTIPNSQAKSIPSDQLFASYHGCQRTFQTRSVSYSSYYKP